MIATDAAIAFLGLGNMGLPMARNLARRGFAVRGYDPALAPGADRDGLKVVATVAEAAGGAAVVITMLPSGGHVLDAYAPGAGIIGEVDAGTLLIDCSTIDIADARAAHDLAARHGLVALDAPVSGGVVGAGAATLTFMVGGEPAAIDAAAPVLEAMGQRVVRCGAAGAGQAAKVCNNLVLGASMIAVGEAFVLAEGLGLAADALYEVLSTSSGQCWAVTTNCPVPGPVPTSPANRGFQGGFATKLMVKDLRLAASAAEHAAVDLALSRNALAQYEAVARTEAADLDFSVVIESIGRKDRT